MLYFNKRFKLINNDGTIIEEAYYVRNINQDIIKLVNDEGQIIGEYIYDAYGNIVNEEELSIFAYENPFRYKGYYHDKETNLYYCQTRYYSPEICRWISIDKIEYLTTNSIIGLNLYAYCNNNPIMNIDEVGKSALGALTHMIVSLIAYIGIIIASLFDSEIRNDMENINWDINNNDESLVLKSSKVSFYKGTPVFRTNMDRSGSFCAIFLNSYADKSTLQHEYGHTVQQMIMGPINYGLMIFLPSWKQWSKRAYYDRPWEVTADVFGGVTTRNHTQKDIDRGYSYLSVSSLFGPIGYLYLLGEN